MHDPGAVSPPCAGPHHLALPEPVLWGDGRASPRGCHRVGVGGPWVLPGRSRVQESRIPQPGWAHRNPLGTHPAYRLTDQGVTVRTDDPLAYSETALVAVRTLRAYSRNARTHDEAQIGQI